jgi:hypothetical protein
LHQTIWQTFPNCLGKELILCLKNTKMKNDKT